MKKICAFLLLMITLVAHAEPTTTRVGIWFVGTGLIGLQVERQWGDEAVRFRAGIFDPAEICLTIQGMHYFSEEATRPFAGIGLFSAVHIENWKMGYFNFLNAPIGVDWRLKERKFVTGEVDVNYALGGIGEGGRKVTLKKSWLPLPGVSYQQSTK